MRGKIIVLSDCRYNCDSDNYDYAIKLGYAYRQTNLSSCMVQTNVAWVERWLAKALAHIEWKMLFTDIIISSIAILAAYYPKVAQSSEVYEVDYRICRNITRTGV